MGKVSTAEKQRRSYNKELRELHAARGTASAKEYERLLIAFDERWSPEVVERRKREGLYKQWARQELGL